VPRVGNDWGDCDPNEPRNRRSRSSIIVEHQGFSLLVDTTPDLREQFLKANAKRPDAVIWTHEHADHCHGIDDLRPFCFYGGDPIPGFARLRTQNELTLRFAFAFAGHQGYPPYLTVDPLGDVTRFGPLTVFVKDLPHGKIDTAGLRFECSGRSLTYTTDFHTLPAEAEALVADTDVWIVDAARHRPHPTHPHLAMTLGWIEKLRPPRSILTHMDQSMDYAALRAMLPSGVEPAYDGMVIDL